jgi:hypothetical protein
VCSFCFAPDPFLSAQSLSLRVHPFHLFLFDIFRISSRGRAKRKNSLPAVLRAAGRQNHDPVGFYPGRISRAKGEKTNISVRKVHFRATMIRVRFLPDAGLHPAARALRGAAICAILRLR